MLGAGKYPASWNRVDRLARTAQSEEPGVRVCRGRILPLRTAAVARVMPTGIRATHGTESLYLRLAARSTGLSFYPDIPRILPCFSGNVITAQASSFAKSLPIF